MNSKLRIGIIGFGKMGLLHGSLISASDDAEIAAVSDTSKLVLNVCKSILPSIKYYTSYTDMLDRGGLDAVVIATPSFSHAEIAEYALKNDVAVFVEKPLTNHLHKADNLIKISREKKITTMVGFCARYTPSFRKAKEILDSGVLGKLAGVKSFMFIADVFAPQSGWRFDKKISGGGVLIDFSVHLVDLLYWFFGPVASLGSSTKKMYSKEVEDEITAILTFKSGLRGAMESSWSNPQYRKSYQRVEITAENGTMIVTDQTIDLMLSSSSKYGSFKPKYVSSDLYEGYYIDIGGSNFSLQMQDFISSLKEGRNSSSDLESGFYVQTLVDAMYRSADSGKEVSLQAPS